MNENFAKISEEEKIIEYKKVLERLHYWKTEYDKLVIMLKEREKNYRKTNLEKDKRIRLLEEKIKTDNYQEKLF